jgi:hypothetical protein
VDAHVQQQDYRTISVVVRDQQRVNRPQSQDTLAGKRTVVGDDEVREQVLDEGGIVSVEYGTSKLLLSILQTF